MKTGYLRDPVFFWSFYWVTESINIYCNYGSIYFCASYLLLRNKLPWQPLLCFRFCWSAVRSELPLCWSHLGSSVAWLRRDGLPHTSVGRVCCGLAHMVSSRHLHVVAGFSDANYTHHVILPLNTLVCTFFFKWGYFSM